MLTTDVFSQLTLAKEPLLHPLKDSCCPINFVRGKKSSGLRPGERSMYKHLISPKFQNNISDSNKQFYKQHYNG